MSRTVKRGGAGRYRIINRLNGVSTFTVGRVIRRLCQGCAAQSVASGLSHGTLGTVGEGYRYIRSGQEGTGGGMVWCKVAVLATAVPMPRDPVSAVSILNQVFKPSGNDWVMRFKARQRGECSQSPGRSGSRQQLSLRAWATKRPEEGAQKQSKRERNKSGEEGGKKRVEARAARAQRASFLPSPLVPPELSSHPPYCDIRGVWVVNTQYHAPSRLAALYVARNISALPTTMDAPLVVTGSVEASPTQTDAAVTSAYASYQQACGPTVAQALQNALVAYNERAGPITDLDNQGSQAWAQENFGSYGTALTGCNDANLALAAVTDSQSASASSTSTSTSTTGTTSSRQIDANA
ncbi:hypothetical protein C8R47DRAFT_1084744 [Mycena vitilis]|nr:hypothetical protein C8R47DRAFT_1084744 [Mycena vitilis]